MYQMYIVAPMVKAGMTYIGVGLIQKPRGLFAGNVEKCATYLRTFFDRCESEIDVALSQAYFLRKRMGVVPLCHPMPSWICVDSIIPCPGVIDKEGADTVGVHSSQTITFIATTHFFHSYYPNFWCGGECGLLAVETKCVVAFSFEVESLVFLASSKFILASFSTANLMRS